MNKKNHKGKFLIFVIISICISIFFIYTNVTAKNDTKIIESVYEFNNYEYIHMNKFKKISLNTNSSTELKEFITTDGNALTIYGLDIDKNIIYKFFGDKKFLTPKILDYNEKETKNTSDEVKLNNKTIRISLLNINNKIYLNDESLSFPSNNSDQIISEQSLEKNISDNVWKNDMDSYKEKICQMVSTNN